MWLSVFFPNVAPAVCFEMSEFGHRGTLAFVCSFFSPMHLDKSYSSGQESLLISKSKKSVTSGEEDLTESRECNWLVDISLFGVAPNLSMSNCCSGTYMDLLQNWLHYISEVKQERILSLLLYASISVLSVCLLQLLPIASSGCPSSTVLPSVTMIGL